MLFSCTFGEDTMHDRIAAVRGKLEKEIAEILHELEVELPKRIEEARAKGDLSENAEYETAKDRQNYLHIRLLQLQRRHSKLSGIELDQIDPLTIGLYSIVDLEEVDGDSNYSYELVLPEEMDLNKDMVSIMSPIGQQLRGKSAGDTVTLTTPARTFDVHVSSFTNILGERHEG